MVDTVRGMDHRDPGPTAAAEHGAPVDPGAALPEQNRRLAGLLRDADLDTPVPTCPGWTLRHLATHVGRGDRWAATIVRERSTGPVDIRGVADGKPPADPSEWLEQGPALLLDAAATGPDEQVWTFLGPRPVSWWLRRRLHEVVVHRADAALALGEPFELEPALAADGVSEWLSLACARPGVALPDTVHLHSTDDGLGTAGEWMVSSADGGSEWTHGHGKGAVAVRGRAADLLLAVSRRMPLDDDRLQVFGDPDVLTGWLERTGF